MAFLLGVAGILSCSSQKTLKPAQAEAEAKQGTKDYFVLSQGGGFTGAYQTYLVQNNGAILQLGMQGDSVDVGTLSQSKTDSLFGVLHHLAIPNRAISAPGNMNFAITTFLDGTKKTLSWADMAEPDPAILNFYKTTILEIQKPKE